MSEAESNLKQEHGPYKILRKATGRAPHSSSLSGPPGMPLSPWHNKAPGELGWTVPPHSCYSRVRKLSPQLSAPGPPHICWLTGKKTFPLCWLWTVGQHLLLERQVTTRPLSAPVCEWRAHLHLAVSLPCLRANLWLGKRLQICICRQKGTSNFPSVAMGQG